MPYSIHRNVRQYHLILLLILTCFFSNQVFANVSVKPQILMAGDSTMAIKALKDYPETGWGMPFATFFADDVQVHNFAQNGRSTRTFKDEGLWQQLINLCQVGDYVIIQFGHNDEVPSKVDRYTTPQQYTANLIEFINGVKAKHAIPLLMSPVTRRNFDQQGVIEETHPYTELAAEVAKQTGVEYIDMDSITRDYFTALGLVNSALRFNQIKANVHPNYPNGVRDNTHFNELGAREVAQLVLAELKKRQHPMLSLLRSPDPKHLTLKY